MRVHHKRQSLWTHPPQPSSRPLPPAFLTVCTVLVSRQHKAIALLKHKAPCVPDLLLLQADEAATDPVVVTPPDSIAAGGAAAGTASFLAGMAAGNSVAEAPGGRSDGAPLQEAGASAEGGAAAAGGTGAAADATSAGATAEQQAAAELDPQLADLAAAAVAAAADGQPAVAAVDAVLPAAADTAGLLADAQLPDGADNTANIAVGAGTAAANDAAAVGIRDAARDSATDSVLMTGNTADGAVQEVLAGRHDGAAAAAADSASQRLLADVPIDSATAHDVPQEAGDSDSAAAALMPDVATIAGNAALAISTRPQIGTLVTQSAGQPTVAATARAAGEARDLGGGPFVGAAAASGSAAGAAGTQEPEAVVAQQRRQVVARLSGRRQGQAPLSEAQQRLQQVWQVRLAERAAEHADAISARAAQSNPQGVAAAKLPNTVYPVEVEAEAPLASIVAL